MFMEQLTILSKGFNKQADKCIAHNLSGSEQNTMSATMADHFRGQ